MTHAEQILNAVCELVATSVNPDSASEQISKRLSAGTYYAVVAGVNGETSYHIALNVPQTEL